MLVAWNGMNIMNKLNFKNGLEDLVKAQYYMNKFIDKYSKRMESDKCQSK